MKTNLLKLTFTCGLARLGAAATAGAQSPVSLLFNPLRSDRRNQFNGKLWLAVFVGCAMLLLEARPVQAVSYDTSTTTVSSSPNPSTSGQSVTFTATVTRTSTHSGTTTPTGTVTFQEGATVLGTGTLSGSGLVATTTFSTNGLSGGSHTITANYPGISLLSSSGTCTQTVSSVFVITTQPVSAVVAVGGTASLSVTGGGTAPLGYQWLKDGAMLPGQTNAMLTYASFQFTNSGSYLVVITNAYGMVISFPASLSVSNAPLKGWGYNSSGQLGNGNTANQYLPITVASNVVTAVVGDMWSLFVTADGTLWGMGDNSYGPGQLGLGTLTGTNRPTVVASNVVAVAAGTGYSLFVKADGTLWGMGYNADGELGNGTTATTNLSTYITNNVVAVAAGQKHSLFIKADGTLWTMGLNWDGQLGIGTSDYTAHTVPIYVTNNVVAAAGGGMFTLFMKADGTLWGIGDNSAGQLGLGNLTQQNRPVYITNSVVSLAIGGSCSMFIKTNGTLWNMGYNGNGELGNGTLINTNLPSYVTNNVVAAAGGNRNSLFMKADGSLWTMGWNYYGTLGNGTYGNTKYPVPAPVSGGLVAASLPNKGGCLAYHCLAIAGVPPVAGALANQTVTVGQPASFTASISSGDGPFTYQWQLSGTNLLNATNALYTLASAALSDAGTGYMVVVTSPFGTTTSASATLTVNNPPTITTQPLSAVVTVGQPASLSVTASLTATNDSPTPYSYQWLKDGDILPGQTNSTLSISSFQFTNSGSYAAAVSSLGGLAISLPASLSVTNAPLKGWGYNSSGQLGNGNTANQYLPITVASNVVTAAVGDSWSLLVTADGTLWGTGDNSQGQLGLGALTSTSVPLVVASNVVAVAAGTLHSLFVKADGTLWGMGYNAYGQLGNGTTTATNLPTYITNNVVAVAAGQSHSLLIKADGTLWTMGMNWSGQLGIGTSDTSAHTVPIYVTNNVVAAAGGSQHTLFMKADGTLWGIGDNSAGQLGIGNLTQQKRPVFVTNNVVSLAIGGSCSMFIKADGTLWNMGYNGNGELGNGTLINTNLPSYVTNNVVAAAGGNRNSLFMKADGSLWAMGWNYYGTLGNGTAGNTKYTNVAPVSGGLFAASLPNKGGSLAYHCLVIAGVPPVAGALTNQTVIVGHPASFTASVTIGDGPFTYQWQRSGTNLTGATAATYTLASAALTDAGSYAVVVASAYGSVTSASATLTVNKAAATVTLTSLSQTYDGTAKAATASTTPAGLTVNVTYNSSANAPTNAGNYTVIGTVVDVNYAGSATNTLVIGKAAPTVTTWPTATAIIEGQALSLSTLSGGAASVSGSFAFTTPATTPPLGTAAQSVTFTPADAANYSTVVGSVNVTVNSAVVIRSAMQNGPWNDPATWGGTVPAAGDNVVIPAGFTVTLNGDTAVLDNLTIAGTLTVPGTNTLKLSGNFTNTGTFTPGTGTVELTGSGDQMLVATAPGSLTFYCLTVNKAAATDKVTATSKLKVSRKLLITRGKLVSASDYADIEIGEDGELQLTGDITVSGDFINSGTLTTAGHGITFDGGVEQNLTLNYVTWFDDVTVATNTMLIETVTDDNALVNGTLLNQGVIRKTQPVTGVDTYYFGLAGNYGAGLAINVTALTGTDPLTAMQVDRIDANHPQAPGTNTTGIYWTITPTGSDYTASVTLPQAGLPAPMVCRYLASRWDWAQTSFDDTTVTRAGLTGFGDFAVFDNPQPIATTVTLDNLSQTWDGTAKAATATTSPANLTVTLTYDGSVNAPTNAGSYTVIGTVAEANYAGSATNTLVIAKAPATVTLGNLSQTYDGTAKSATASTTPDGLTVALTYNGSAAAPANAGNYRVIGTVVDASYAGSGTNILVIGQAGQVITFSALAAVVYGDPPLTLSASASSGLPVSYASADTAIATVSGNTVTVLTAGSTVLMASQVGDANYLAATNVSQTLVVSDLLMGLSIQMQTNGVSHITTNHLGRLVTNYDYQPSLTVTGNLGRDYTIQYREDLTGTNWSVLTTLTNLPVSPYQVTDPATNPARFYRLRQP